MVAKRWGTPYVTRNMTKKKQSSLNHWRWWSSNVPSLDESVGEGDALHQVVRLEKVVLFRPPSKCKPKVKTNAEERSLNDVWAKGIDLSTTA